MVRYSSMALIACFKVTLLLITVDVSIGFPINNSQSITCVNGLCTACTNGMCKNYNQGGGIVCTNGICKELVNSDTVKNEFFGSAAGYIQDIDDGTAHDITSYVHAQLIAGLAAGFANLPSWLF